MTNFNKAPWTESESVWTEVTSGKGDCHSLNFRFLEHKIMQCLNFSMMSVLLLFWDLFSWFCPRGLRDPSSPIRDRTWAPAVKTPSPNHWTTRELPEIFLSLFLSFYSFLYLILAVLGLRCCARTFSTCGAKATHCGSVSCFRAQSLGYTGFSSCGSLQRVETFWTRDGTHALCTSRWIPNPLGHQGSPRSFFFNVRIDYCNFLSTAFVAWHPINFDKLYAYFHFT